MEARGLEEAGEPEHRRRPRLRGKRLHRRGEEGEASLLWICFASMILFDRQSSDPWIRSHLRQKPDSTRIRYPLLKAVSSNQRRRILFFALWAGPLR